MPKPFGTPTSLATSVRAALGHRDHQVAKPFAPNAKPQGVVAKVQNAIKDVKAPKVPKPPQLPVITPADDNPDAVPTQSATKPSDGVVKPPKPPTQTKLAKIGGEVHNIAKKRKPASSANLARRTVNYHRTPKSTLQ